MTKPRTQPNPPDKFIGSFVASLVEDYLYKPLVAVFRAAGNS